jgi:hypothetical protein
MLLRKIKKCRGFCEIRVFAANAEFRFTKIELKVMELQKFPFFRNNSVYLPTYRCVKNG